jgi:hypothetical protein
MYRIGSEQATNLFFRIVPVSSGHKKDDRTQLYHTVHDVTQNVTIIDGSLPLQGHHYDLLLREKASIREKRKLQQQQQQQLAPLVSAREIPCAYGLLIVYLYVSSPFCRTMIHN